MMKPRLRKPRFERCPETPPVALTQRDVLLLNFINRHRWVRSDHLTPLMPGSRQHLTRRLGRLFHAGYLDRPLAQWHLRRPFNSHFVYCLTSRGQKALRQRGVTTFASIPKSRAASAALSLSHALRVTDIVVLFRSAAAARGLRFVLHHEWTRDGNDSSASQLHVLRWYLRFRDEGHTIQTGVIPDAAFALEAPAGERSYFLVEVDRGTMPICRSDFQQSSFLRKIIAYRETRRAGILWKRHEVSGFRVLVVAESARRLASLQTATAGCFSRGESAMFLFAVAGELLSGSNALQYRWQTCSGKRVTSLLG